MDGAIKAAYKRLEHVMQDEEAYRSYWSQRKAEHDLVSGLNGARHEGREQGIAEGIFQGKAEEREKWQNFVAGKDAEIARLREQLEKNGTSI